MSRLSRLREALRITGKGALVRPLLPYQTVLCLEEANRLLLKLYQSAEVTRLNMQDVSLYQAGTMDHTDDIHHDLLDVINQLDTLTTHVAKLVEEVRRSNDVVTREQQQLHTRRSPWRVFSNPR